MAIKISDFILIRQPVFNTDVYEQGMQQALQLSLFRAAIYQASPAFYRQLEKAGFELDRLNAKEQFTLWKYFNRSSFRPTPFGLFATISGGSWTTGNAPLLAGGEPLQAIIGYDQELVNRIATIALKENQDGLTYEGNPTLYRVGQHYRFIATEVTKGEKRRFQLQSARYSTVLRDLICFCQPPKGTAAIIEHIASRANCEIAEATDYFNFLTDAQLLVPRQRATIAGQDYLHALQYQFGLSGHHLFSAGQWLEKLQRCGLPGVAELQQIRDQVTVLLPEASFSQPVNITLLRKNVNPSLPAGFKASLQDGLKALQALSAQREVAGLSAFAMDFRKHFEGQRIPLLKALDPERGIGYQEPELENPNPLLETIHLSNRSKASKPAQWHQSHAYLMQRWIEMADRQQSIMELDDAGLAQCAGDAESGAGTGFAVLFRVAQEQVYLESAGGCNAPAMIGRFTLADPGIAAAAAQMAQYVEQLNPDVLFAELLHLTDPHTDNINRRHKIWSYEIPVTAVSESYDPEKTIALSDLYLEEIGGKVYLWSKRHQKLVIPRLTSAYNHQIDRLPLFRFLADLSYQFGNTDLAFSLRDHFPGLTYYPRVSYRSAILSLATWIIKTPESGAGQTGLQNPGTFFAGFIQAHELPAVFTAVEGDQQLVFHRDLPMDACSFLEYLKGRDQVILQEYITGEHPRAAETPSFSMQINAFILPERPLTIPAVPLDFRLEKQRRKFMPGSEWLYLKIYLPRLSSTRMLLKLWPLLKRSYGHGKIEKWFFIRYEDHAPHLRLRLKINPEDIQQVLLGFRQLLEEDIHQQVIREFQLDVYSRELERYHASGISGTEGFFYASSHFVLSYLQRGRNRQVPETYLAALCSVHAIMERMILKEADRENFAAESYQALLTEFDGGKVKYELDLKFRQVRPAITELLNLEKPFGSGNLDRAFRQLKKAADVLNEQADTNREVREDYLRSILHLHLNRLFTDQQRMQEMLIYFLLYKWLSGQRAMIRQRYA